MLQPIASELQCRGGPTRPTTTANPCHDGERLHQERPRLLGIQRTAQRYPLRDPGSPWQTIRAIQEA